MIGDASEAVKAEETPRPASPFQADIKGLFPSLHYSSAFCSFMFSSC